MSTFAKGLGSRALTPRLGTSNDRNMTDLRSHGSTAVTDSSWPYIEDGEGRPLVLLDGFLCHRTALDRP
jgi:hypothetical protein